MPAVVFNHGTGKTAPCVLHSHQSLGRSYQHSVAPYQKSSTLNIAQSYFVANNRSDALPTLTNCCTGLRSSSWPLCHSQHLHHAAFWCGGSLLAEEFSFSDLLPIPVTGAKTGALVLACWASGICSTGKGLHFLMPGRHHIFGFLEWH